jgi:hypothetical protein
MNEPAHFDSQQASARAETVTERSPQSVASKRTGNSLHSRWPEWTALCAYATVLAWAIPFHEPWGDEAQAWQLARTLPLRSLFQIYIRYEGSPGLWYLVLWALNRAHVSYAGMHWFCGVIAVAASALLIFKSPLPRYLRLMLPFAYFLLFQFAVVARSYVLVPILLYLIAICWRKSPLILALLLGLLANVSLHTAMISGGLAMVYAIGCVRGQTPGINFSARRRIQALAILLCFYMAAVWTAWPPHDQGFKTETGPLFIVFIVHFIGLCGPWGMALPFWIAIALQLRARGASLFLLPLLLFVAFSLAVHVAFWHSGLLFPFAICILWITWPAPDDPRSRYESIGRIGLVAFAALQICWSAYALEFDHYHAYAPDQDAAEFLRPLVRDGATIAVSYVGDTGCQACGSGGLMPYFDRGLYINEPDPFWSWSTHNPTEQLFQRLLPTHPDIVILEAAPIHPDRPINLDDPKIRQVANAGYVFTHMFCGEMPEGFELKRKSCHLIFQASESQQNHPAK